MTTGSSSISLAWPTTPGVRYQVEWSDDLALWHPAGSSIIASTSGMTWTDDGSQTGSSPNTQNHRFYRLRISE